MICKTCGTEIADKALICYRCGNATFEARRKPPPPRSTGRDAIMAAGLVVLILAALFMGQVATDDVPPVVTYAVAGLATVVLVYRLLRRR